MGEGGRLVTRARRAPGGAFERPGLFQGTAAPHGGGPLLPYSGRPRVAGIGQRAEVVSRLTSFEVYLAAAD
jgi:hypothetical protein